MNENIILSMIKPYLKGMLLTYDDFDNIFSDILSPKEQYEITSLLADKGIELVDSYDEQEDASLGYKYYQMALPYSKNGFMTYDSFEIAFSDYSRKQQYEIVEELYSYGIELADSLDGVTVVGRADVSLVPDDNDGIFNILYDENIFKDTSNSSEIIHINKIVKQSNATLCALIQQGNMQAKQDICIKNQRLVSKYAASYYGYYGSDLDIEDLEQAGYMGLIDAAENFDLSRDTAFSTYATPKIISYIVRETINTGFTIRLPVHIVEKIAKITKLDAAFDSAGMNYDERMTSISDELQTPAEEIKYLLSIRQQYMQCTSLNIPVGEDEVTELEEFIKDDDALSVEDEVDNILLSETIQNVLSTLKPKEQKAIMLRFGFINNKIHTLEEIGNMYGVTKERARQIIEKALRKLKHPTKKNKLKDYYYGVKNGKSSEKSF
ncbi:MAG: sigma-70 family RNA polymerase sigma factor [Ruminiclostridium sp.]|nr:sigma-70 family RNA polymerase sigma factor [Ruminiclostridium sp.]